MGAQHSTVGRAKSLDESVHQYGNNRQGSASISQQLSGNYYHIVLLQPKIKCSMLCFTYFLKKFLDHLRSNDGHTNRVERDQRTKSTLVIVHRPSLSDPSTGPGRVEDDPLFKKLGELPMFVPLMHEFETSSKLFGARNRALSDIRSKVVPTPFIHIVRLYEDRLKRHADSLNVEQGRLTKCVREVDMDITSIFKALTDRQKKFAKHTENLGKMNEIHHTLSKCQNVLKECERNLQILNGFLPSSDRLEPFSWSEMFNDVHQDMTLTSDSVVGGSEITGTGNNLESDESVEVAVEQGES